MAHALREAYGALVDAKLRASLVTKDNVIFNTKYEGTPTAGAVKIPVRDGEAQVADYNKTSLGSNTVKYGSTVYITATSFADKFVNEYIDGYEAAALPDNLVADRLDSAGYALASAEDTAAIDCLVKAVQGKDRAGNAFGSTDPRYNATGTSVTETSNVFADIMGLVTAMDTANVPQENRWLIVTPALYAKLVKSSDFVKQSDMGQELVMTGAVGMIAGLAIYKCSKLITLGDNQGAGANKDIKAIAGHPEYCTRVDAWQALPVVVDGNADANIVGGSLVKGRKIYLHEVTKPQAFAYIIEA